MTAAVLAPDPDMPRVWRRFLLACAASLALHLALLIGVHINPTGGVPNLTAMSQVISARLEPLPPDSAPPLITPTPAVLPAPVAPVHLSPVPAAKPVTTPSTGLDLPLARDPTYYPAKQLDVYPEPVAAIKPPYPDSALDAHVNGSVTVLLLIDEFGVVNDVSVAKADPPGYFEEAALAAFRAARFVPAQRQGHKVKSRVLIKVNFDFDADQRKQQ